MIGNTTASQQKIALQPEQTVEILAASGQNISVSSTVQGATLQNGALVVRFADNSTLVIKNYSEIAGQGPLPTLTAANGETIALDRLIQGTEPAAPVRQAANADGDFVPTLTDGTPVAAQKAPAAQTANAETIAMPKAGEDVVVTLEDGVNYVFGFTMTDPASVTQQGNQLVITFKNGGEIIIPNYGQFQNDPTAPQIALKDGTALTASNMGDILASAAELNAVEPAAGGGAGGGRGGFGFQSAFAATPFQALDPIGPINPTLLNYNVTDRRPEPILIDPAAPVPVLAPPALTVENKQVKEDGSVTLTVEAELPPGAPVDTYLVVTITGIPATWISGNPADLNGGTYDPGTETWTFTVPPGQNFAGPGPKIYPPADTDNDLLDIDVAVTHYDNTGTVINTTTGEIDVIVDAVVDPHTVTASVSGDEDTAIPVNISINPGGDSADGSESITDINISGVPAGWTLSAGVKNADGSYTLTEGQLVGLTLTPPANYSSPGNPQVKLIVKVTEYDQPSDGEYDYTDNTHVSTTEVIVNVNPVPDAPVLNVEDKQVYEDGSVALNFTANLVDTDGSEQLTVSISGIPASWIKADSFTLSGGTYDAATGTWTKTLAAGENFAGPGPLVYPPANSDVDLNGLVVRATSTEVANQTSATATDNMNVIVDAVIDAPTINAGADFSAAENTDIPLNIVINRGDDTQDGSEVLSNVTISGVPVGATLSAGSYDAATGNWTLTPAQLNGLTLRPAANWNGTISLNVSVTETDVPTDLDFDDTNNTATVTDNLVITVQPVANIPTVNVEDVRVKEDGSVKLVVDADMAPNSTPGDYLVVSISGIPASWGLANLQGGTFANGVWTLKVPAGQNYLDGPIFSPPADSDVDLNNLQVTVRQYNANDQLEGTATDTASIIVDAVIDGPAINADDVTGNEDTAIPLNISINRGGDNDGSETLGSVEILGVPAGAQLSAGALRSDGVWVVGVNELPGLTLTPPANYSGNFNLTIRVTETDNPTDQEYDLTDNTATVTDVIKVTVTPVADKPDLAVVDKQVKEDGSVALQISASLKDTDGSETLTVSIAGFKPGWGVDTSVSGGTYNAATGIWTLTLPAGVTSFSGGPTVRPPADSDVDLTGLVVTATAREPNGSTATNTGTMNVIVDAVIDAPTLNVSNASGEENTPIALNIQVGRGGDSTDGSETIDSIIISGVPAGASLSAGTKNADGTWTLTQGQLNGLTLNNAREGTFTLTVSVTETDNPSDQEYDLSDNTATVTRTIRVTVGQDDVPQIIDPAARVVDETDLGTAATTLTGTIQADFGADAPGTFAATGVSSFSFGGSAKNGALTSKGVPVTVSLEGDTYVGKANGAEVFRLKLNPNGTYEFKLVGTLDHADVNNPNDSITLNFGVTARDSDGDTDTTTLTVRVHDDGVTANDDHNTVVLNANGTGSAMGNVVTGLNGGPGAADDLSNDNVNNVTQVAFGGTTINVPTGGFATIMGNYGVLKIFSDGSYTYTLDPSKTTTTTVVPVTTTTGSSTSTGGTTTSPDGTTTTTVSTSTNVSVVTTTTVTTVVGNITDTFTYTLRDGDGDSDTAVLTFNGDGASRPTLTVRDEYIKEDGQGQLNIQASLTDPNETLTVTVTGFGPGWTVDTSQSGGTYNAATGTWSITLPRGQNFNGGPIVRPPADSDADLNDLSVTAYSRTATGATGISTGQIDIIVDAVIDGPTLTVNNASGEEGTQIALAINVGRGGDSTDGSEVLSAIRITGVPAGAVLSAGTKNADGSWSLTLGQLTNLKITPPAGFSGSFNLNVSVTDTETNLSGREYDYSDNTATVTRTLTVNVGADDVPQIIEPAAKVVDETALSAGAQTVGGTVQADFGSDGPGTFAATGANTFSFTGAKGGALTHNGVAVVVTQTGNTYVGKAGAVEVFRLQINADGTYSFVLRDNLDHANASNPDDIITLNFGVTARDSDGDTATTNIQIRVHDDGPRAFNDVNNLTMNDAGAGSANGNVVTGVNGGAGAADTLSQDNGNVISQVKFGAMTINVPASGQATIEGTYGTLKISADGQYTYTLKPATAGSVTGTATDVFTYTLMDGDGDTSTATLTLNALGSTFKVGTNDDDRGTYSDPYEVGTGTGTITGRGGNDILVGDVGGVTQGAGKDYNVVMILDVSGSMGSRTDPNSPYSLLMNAVRNLMADFANYEGGEVRVHFVPFTQSFGDNAGNSWIGNFDITNPAEYQAMLNYLNQVATFTANGGWTNYEAGIAAANYYLQGNRTDVDPIPGAENYTYFISDGQPNYYLQGELGAGAVYVAGTSQQAMDQIRGADGSNDIATLQGLSTVIGIGIGNQVNMGHINEIDSDGQGTHVTDPNQLNATLSGSNPINQLDNVGGDQIVGGDGNDIIFGDSLNTDALAAARGVDLPEGSGWAVFEALEAGPGWTRADTLNYIRANANELARETIVNGEGRIGGNDTLLGGVGNDIIFGQEGNDRIIGGAGNDILSGGSGRDTFVYQSMNDGVDTIVDFSTAEGDVLDISGVLSGYDPLTEQLADFVRIVHSGGNSHVQVDVTGSGAAYQTVAVLQGVNVDVDQLVTAGNLIA